MAKQLGEFVYNFAMRERQRVIWKDNFYFGYLTALPVPRLYNVDDKILSGRGAVDGMRIGRVNGCTKRKPTPLPLWGGALFESRPGYRLS
jgi:hypothetical protein